MSNTTPIGVGSTVWIFDINRRVYQPREMGKMSGPPIWREHWRPLKIVDETSRSWVLEYGQKIPKRIRGSAAILFSELELDRACFVHDHAHRIAREVGNITDDVLLSKVAALIGYEPGDKS